MSSVILYDGVCGLCNGMVRFILPRDRRGVFRFAALQSDFAQRELERLGHRASSLDTFYVIESFGEPGETLSWKSRAALAVARGLGWWWLGWLRLVPRGLSDRIYDVVARYRYAWFGRHTTCPLPQPEHRARFLDH